MCRSGVTGETEDIGLGQSRPVSRASGINTREEMVQSELEIWGLEGWEL